MTTTRIQRNAIMITASVLIVGLAAFLIVTKINTSGKIKKLSTQNDSLKSEYNSLYNESVINQEKLNSALMDKNVEISTKDTALADMDKKLKEMQRLLSKKDAAVKTLNETVKNALLSFKTDELSVEVKDGKVYVSMMDKLLFKSGSEVVEKKGTDALKKLAVVLNKNPKVNIQVEGHTDNVPISNSLYKDNWDLSVARSTSVVRFLVSNCKVSNERLTAAGKGEFYPVASNKTEDGRAKNRRTDIILTPDLDELYAIISKTDKKQSSTNTSNTKTKKSK